MTTPDKEQNTNETQHPDDFYQQVLGKGKPKEFSATEIQQKQQEWEHYNEPVLEKNGFNDFPNYFYAGFWIRLFAFVIDLLCINAVTGILLDVIFRIFGGATSGPTFSLHGMASLLIYLAYFVLLTKLNHGQTIGKMIFGIRVISFTEEQLSWQTVLVREAAGRFILQANPFLYFGYLPTAFSTKKQHVADYFAETSVVTLNVIQAFNKQAHI